MLSLGVRSGILLGIFAIVVGLLGLAPAFAALPERFLIIVAVVVPVIGLVFTGWRGRRRTGRLAGSLLAAALAGGMTGLCGGLALLTLDQIFVNTVSKQQDILVNFPRSGFATMRVYLLSKDVINIIAGLILGTGGGALIGLVGGRLAVTRFLARTPDEVPARRR